MSNRQTAANPSSRATTEGFDYDTAFQINSGLLTTEDQQKLKIARVAIMGMFAGGSIAIMLARAGFTKFSLIDHHKYKIDDMNRDIGCFVDTLGNNKAEVIKQEILRINPEASVDTYTEAVKLEEVGKLIQQSDVYFAQADDLAFSSKSLVVAQQKKRFAISFMPSGITGYIIVLHPEGSHLIDPTDLFGSPKNLSYRQLYYFLRNPLNRCGRRWHITEGKWRIDWFNRWRNRQVIEAQLCPSVWLGASLACMEAIKYITGRWQMVKAPRMWHLVTAENRIKTERFRRRSWLFGKFIYWTFGIKWLGIGRRYQKYTARRLMRELADMQKQENEGREVRPPFMWRHLI
jgi:molybdopterin/thiamine biosynthesis adenylyltransferase